MKKMPTLFDVDLVHPDEVKASNFIYKISQSGFIARNDVYLKNYINADLGIAFAHIKSNYKKYVIEGGWSEKKYEDIVYLIAKDRKMLIPGVFLAYGSKYDDGKLNREVSLERRKYGDLQQKDDKQVSDEEQELLDYIAKHGGGL